MMVNLNGVETLYYRYADNQGSLIALTDVSGNVVEKYAFDPWGARRNPNDWTQKDTRTSFMTNRGYTGHEHLDAFSIINMNGRVYDPLTAMFFSPDPFIQSAGDWKNYNRYSYCMNNPTKYTDPSGYQQCYVEMPSFVSIDWGFSGGSSGGGRNQQFKNWFDHQGPISYNYDNGRYEYVSSGAEAGANEAMNYLFRGTTHTTVTGQAASYAYQNLGRADAVTNGQLANIGNNIKRYAAEIVNRTNALALMITSSKALTAISEMALEDVFNSTVSFISTKANVYLFFLTLQGDSEHPGYAKDFHEERGTPHSYSSDPVIKGYENDKYIQSGGMPPKGSLIPIAGVIIYEIYNNWPKPNLPRPINSVQPIYQQQPIRYDQYFLNLK
ncbi:MAG: hypothetical protein JZU53_04280 [Paludibacter sp.]|nr:hypothetical protein [Paludibacter sp.]